jgi:hypothetical protein
MIIDADRAPAELQRTTAVGRLHVEEWGTGDRVVLVHGSLATGAEESEAQRPLANQGLRLVVFDRRCCGRSPFATGEDFLARAVNKVATPALGPLIDPAAKTVARTTVADLIGFWALWHLECGFEGVERFGYSQATIYRKVKRFRPRSEMPQAGSLMAPGLSGNYRTCFTAKRGELSAISAEPN